MKRVKAVIAYDGSRFEGFQAQKHTFNTVSYKLEVALKSLGIESKILASGRTDKGVHATAQVVSFNLPDYWSDLAQLKSFLNLKLSPHIGIKKISFVPSEFHPRFSAKRRAYRYILAPKVTPFTASYLTPLPKKIDFEKMQEASKLFEGKHDFIYFHKTGSEPKTTVREIYKATLYSYQELKVFYFEANGFLRAQVRMISEAVLKVGKGELGLKELKLQLEGKEQYTTSLAPPNGLYLCRVVY